MIDREAFEAAKKAMYDLRGLKFSIRDEWLEAAITAYLTHAGEGAVPVGWAYEYYEFGDIWTRSVILNRPDGGANPPTKHYGSPVRNVRPLYAAPHPPRQAGAREGGKKRTFQPCPFCGCKMVKLQREARKDTGTHRFAAYCVGCGAMPYASKERKVDAINAWNGRSSATTPPAPDEAVEAEPNGALAELTKWTFVVQHNPNCPSPWLVRLPAPGKSIDMLPYRNNPWIPPKEETDDVLGFGATFEAAAHAALSEQKVIADLRARSRRDVGGGI